MRTQAMLKPEADLLELMRADWQVQNKHQAAEAAVDLEAARESILAGQDQTRSLRGDAGPLVDSWVRTGRPFSIRFIETSGPDSVEEGKGQRSQCHRGSVLRQVDYTVESDYIADAVAHLQGNEDVDALLAHTTPLGGTRYNLRYNICTTTSFGSGVGHWWQPS
jgi:hypothetical protein